MNRFSLSLFRRIFIFFGLVALFIALNGAVASWVIWRQYDHLTACLAAGKWPMESGVLEIEAVPEQDGNWVEQDAWRIRAVRTDRLQGIEVALPKQDFSPLRVWSEGSSLHLAAAQGGVYYHAAEGDFSEIPSALREASAVLPAISWGKRILASWVLQPLITGVRVQDGALSWRISLAQGTVWTGGGLGVREADVRVKNWHGRLVWRQETPEAERFALASRAETTTPQAGKPSEKTAGEGHSSELQAEFFGLSRDNARLEARGQEVLGSELAAGLAEGIRILALQLAPARIEPDAVRREGAGWLEIRDGHRQMYLSGSPSEMGFQHGSLAAENIRRVSRRLVYGVGLLYSIKQGQWFPQAARELVERQRPFIAPAYFEEMKGLAEGSGLPLDLIQAANIFPEFFHCSGAAVMGEASAGGELLHARVLDYMTEIGLQDEAVVLAVARPGAHQFVTVGYLGFIGSVTGMNEKQVAIGEMGGAGQGDWDGVPMSLLIRQALETCNTLDEVEQLMRESPRTCEYYYLITDGKGPSALGVAATPDTFETFGPGVWHEKLTQPMADAVLLSGGGRYENLVERVRENYGKIDRERLIEIIKRPVAMVSNLHNVVFQPQSLKLSVADAVRGGLACDQPYRTYQWSDLFSAAPVR